MNKEENTISAQLIDIFGNVMKMEQETINRESQERLSMTEIHTIAAAGMEEFSSMSEIAGKLHVTVGTLTVGMNNLVKKGYVERFKSERDRRIVKVGLTKKGKEIYRIHEAFHRKLGRTLIKGMTEAEKKVVRNAVANLEEFICRECRNLEIM